MKNFGKSFCRWLVVCGAGVGAYSAVIHDIAAMYANVGYMVFGTLGYCVIVKFSR